MDPKKQLNITESEYQAIQELIENPESPVGIDAKQTHILILQKLIKIEERISALEQRLEQSNDNA